MMSALWQDSVTSNAAEEFVSVLDRRISHEVDAVAAAWPARPLLNAGGKQLRARLLWLAAAAAGPERIVSRNEVLVRAAAAVELAHLGSLIHDDIVDGAATRRGVTAVHRRHGVEVAVRTGSALIYMASALVASFPAPIRRVIGGALLATCRGQVRELLELFQLCTRRKRRAIIRDKTAAFFELALRLGSILVGGSPAHEIALRRFGRSFGMAFQIADDVMDLVGDPAVLGRANGADLQSGVMTLPILLAAERDPWVREKLTAARSPGADIETCIDRIRAAGGIARARREGKRWLARAGAALRPLGARAAADALRSMADKDLLVSSRRHAPALDVEAAPLSEPLRFTTADASAREPACPTSLDAADVAVADCLDAIEPRVSLGLAGLLRDPSTATAVRLLRRRLTPSGDHSLELATALQAAAVARVVLDRQLRSAPVAALALADCCDAVTLVSLAGTPAHRHAELTARILRELSPPAPHSRGRSHQSHRPSCRDVPRTTHIDVPAP